MSCYYAQSPDSLSLDGTWEIIFDENNEGRKAKWMESANFEMHPQKQSISVPAAWETIKQDYEGVAFYRKIFEVPQNWEGNIIRLQFAAVNYLTEVWLNDEVVGYHEGGFTPFEFRVDEMIRPGESNSVTLRVVGPLFLSDKEIDGMKALETPQWRGGITGGIWQSVQLVATGETYVEEVFIEPNIQDHTASFHIELDHTGLMNTSVQLEIDIAEAEYPATVIATLQETIDLHGGINQYKQELEIPNVKYWSPDHPHLYLAEVKIRKAGAISDRWTTRFGMRELTIKDKDFYLNGEKIYIKAAFFEGLYPNEIAYPDSEEMASKEIRLAKEAGFNMIRPWRRPPGPMWLDLADEMGVLVVGSPALECMQLPLSTPYLPWRVENEVRQAILRDRNRACIVQWELFNELHRPVLKQMIRPMAMLARELDPTRLILDESGGWAYGANMYLPYQYEPTKFNDIHNYPGPFINQRHYAGFLSIGMTPEEKKAAGLNGPTPGRNVVPGLMSYISELGYGSLPDLSKVNKQFKKEGNPLTPAYRYHQRIAAQQQEVLIESGFDKLYPDMQSFYLDQQYIHGAANKRMIEAVRMNPEVDGYCIHALVAGDWILGAGLLDIWRNPKSYAYEATKAANQPRLISIRTFPRNVYADQGTEIEVLSVNEQEAVDAILHVEITSEEGDMVYEEKHEMDWQAGISQIFKENISTGEWKGKYKLLVKVLDENGNQIAENQSEIEVFSQESLAIEQTQIAVIDQEGMLKTYLESKGINPLGFSTETSNKIPVLVSNGVNSIDPDLTEELMAFIHSGGKVAFLGGVNEAVESDNTLPFQAKVHPVVGLWTCIPHLVHEHPLFEGLPANTMMHDSYENVWARTSLRDLEAEGGDEFQPIVGSIGFDWFSEGHNMHYSGPGDSWWGADVAELSLGEGWYILSQLRILENLGKDPVADKILGNIIRYMNRD